MKPRHSIGLALSLVALATVAPVGSAHAARGMEVAIQDDGVLVAQAYYHRNQALVQVRRLEASRIRVNLNWTAVLGRQARMRRAPRHVRYGWSVYDGIVYAAGLRGIKVQLAVTGPAPAWATANHRPGVVAPNARQYGRFAAAVASHFRGRVDRFSVWNEPNYKGWIQPQRRAARIYRALYLAGWGAIKRVDPTATVLIGETAPYSIRRLAISPLQFLRDVTCTGLDWRPHGHCTPLKTDGYAHHPYDFKHRPNYRYPGADNVTIGVLSRLTGALDRLAATGALQTPAGRAPDVYLTEYGLFASGKRRLRPAVQANYLTQAFRIAQANSHVREMLQYLLVQPSRRYRFFDTSIVTRRGRPTKAYIALAAWARGAAASGAILRPSPPAKPAPGQPAPQPPPSRGGGGAPGGGGGGGGRPSPPQSCPGGLPAIFGGCPPIG